jgi:hypothetical protein
LARKKKGAYGKRYALEDKQAILRAWQLELGKASPMPKSKFCAANGITTITLGKWAKAVPMGAPLATDNIVAEPELDAVIFVDETPRDVVIVGDDSVAGIILAIKDHQARIDELKARLRNWVDAL